GADPYCERIRVEPRSAALGAGLGELVLPQKHADVLLVPLLLEILEEREDAHVPPLAAVEQLAPDGGLQLVPRLRRIGIEAARALGQHPPAGLVTRLGPGIDGALGQTARRVRH